MKLEVNVLWNTVFLRIGEGVIELPQKSNKEAVQLASTIWEDWEGGTLSFLHENIAYDIKVDDEDTIYVIHPSGKYKVMNDLQLAEWVMGREMKVI